MIPRNEEKRPELGDYSRREMGTRRVRWTAEEDEALRAGVDKYGTGKWSNILKDPELCDLLWLRSNNDLKDKWRNWSVSNNRGPKEEKSRTLKPNSEGAAVLLSNPKTYTPVTNVTRDAPAVLVTSDSSRSSVDGKLASRYDGIIFEALSTSKDPNGLNASTIISFVEQRQRNEGPVPIHFRKYLTRRLKKLTQRDKLEKNGSYRLRIEDPLSRTKMPPLKQNEIQPMQVPGTTTIRQYLCRIVETEEEAAIAAAYTIVEAENKAYVAAESVMEAERVSKMAEDTDVLLQLAIENFHTCSSGEIVLVE